MQWIIIAINFICMFWIGLKILKINRFTKHFRLYDEFHSFKRKKSLFEKIQNRYLDQTFLNERFNITEILTGYFIWSILSITICLSFLDQSISKYLMILLLVVLPIFCMEKYLKIVDLSIDKGIFNLLTQINARLIKSEDIIVVLHESQSIIENKYILKIIQQFNQSIKMGISPIQAFQNVQNSTRNEYLKYIFLNIEIVFHRRGSITDLMRAIENEFTSIQVEINRRKVELEHERNLMFFSLFLVVFIMLKVINDNDYILGFFLLHYGFFIVLALIFLIGVTILATANIKNY